MGWRVTCKGAEWSCFVTEAPKGWGGVLPAIRGGVSGKEGEAFSKGERIKFLLHQLHLKGVSGEKRWGGEDTVLPELIVLLYLPCAVQDALDT